MPKMKTRSGAKKRFHVTARGKVKRASAFRSHILTSKSRKRKRKLRKGGFVSEANLKTIRDMIQR
jgi:large subunit ribosomal protein L35